MDEKDRQIIRVLQQNGRITNQDLAERVNLSPSPCLRRVKLLEKAGIIQGYGAQINAKAYGLSVMAFAAIRLERHDDETVATFERAVAQMSEVLDCYVMAGQADYQLRVVVQNLESYETFVRNRLQRIGGLASIDTRFAYGTVKETSVFPDIQSG
ncbi:Lrp/AsnC family transcriptional regulator [Tateyamaria sp. ANG-S1]|uniref:Lrp/AsnC family transcriptional regulator n=1 Tax=Tateyamaria sp. ANG-S1 TaxID=1577905 RepID=UPI00057F0607|nr:Lrp/AsnC family transcriptional regulator [Tateyamaria sp. ANG-S1]KIC51373.1 AsnC family transcriptional regulator [Tateyamaria sp. ANG-S1]